MPPRRSARATAAADSAVPANVPAGKRTAAAKTAIAKPAARGRKRGPANAEPESDETPEPQSPPRKRARSTSKSAASTTAAKAAKTTKPAKKAEKAETKPTPRARSRSAAPLTRKATDASIASTTTSKKSVKKTAPAPEPVPQSVPYFNPLPKPSEHARPALQLFGWGAGNFGQFGMGPDQLGEIGKPRRNPWVDEQIEDGIFGGEGAGLEAIAAGGLHSLFIDEKGTIWSCGTNDDAALGRITQDVPDPADSSKTLDIDELTAVPHPVQSLVDEKFRAVKVAAGDSISAAVSDEGEFRVWGCFRAMEGHLGFTDGKKHQFIPVSVLELSKKPGDYEKVVDVVCGNNHLLALTTHGNAYAWGAGEQGQLGHRVMERRKATGLVPYKVTVGRSRKIRVVGAGNYHSFAVDDQGDVWGWGMNSMGQTGTGLAEKSSTDVEVQAPKKVIGLSKEELSGETVVQIVGGDHHTLFLTSGGKVYACGRANGGQLGLAEDHPALKDSKYEGAVAKPTLVDFPDSDDPVVQIAAGTHNNLAVTKGGALYGWGSGQQSELGLGDEEEVKTPTIIVRKTGGSFAAIVASCGGQHALGLFRKKT